VDSLEEKRLGIGVHEPGRLAKRVEDRGDLVPRRVGRGLIECFVDDLIYAAVSAAKSLDRQLTTWLPKVTAIVSR
jgi:hypothetical protein